MSLFAPLRLRRSGVGINLRVVLATLGDGVSDRYCIIDLSVTSWRGVSPPPGRSRHSVLGRSHGRVCRHRSRGTAPPGRRRGTTSTGLYVALFAAPPASIGGERGSRQRPRTYVALLLVQVVGGDQGVGVDAEQQLSLSSTSSLPPRPPRHSRRDLLPSPRPRFYPYTLCPIPAALPRPAETLAQAG